MPALSVSEWVGDCIKTGITALALTYGTPATAVPVVKRKVGVSPVTKTVPEVVVLVDEEERTEAIDALTKLKTYSGVVLFVLPGGHTLADDPTPRQWRKLAEEVVDDKARATFAGPPTGARFNRSDAVGGKLPFDPAALPKDLNYAWVAFAIEVLEKRVTT